MDAIVAQKQDQATYLYDRRPDHGARALIEAKEAFPAMEELVLATRRDLCIGLRIFDPETRLRSNAVRALGLETWGDLVAHVSARGVSVRLLLTDFEPVVADRLHQRSWTALRGFAKAVAARGDPDHFQAIAALHEGEFGWLIRLGLWPLLKLKAERLASGASGLVDFQNWRLFRKKGGVPGRSVSGPPRMWPATYHQKFLVADSDRAIVGGLDIDERRYDDPDHARPAERTWHDVSLEVSGPAAGDARHHFDSLWNREVPRFNARLTRMGAPSSDLLAPVRPVDPAPMAGERAARGAPSLRLVRTSSKPSGSPVSVGPVADVIELERAHVDQIAGARDLIYLESQFLRSVPVADALVKAGRTQPGLRLIVLLPAAPDNIVFEGDRGMAARYGEWLQVRALERIGKAFGDRAGFFCLTRGAPGLEEAERDAVDGHEIAYVHAKVAIADAKSAIVSSANLNGRSLRWDRETGFVWENPQGVSAFRDRLWSQHLRGAFDAERAGSGAKALAMWRAAADEGPEGDDCAQVAAYPLGKASAFSFYSPFVPHDMV